jgi:hypothetical protein
MSSCTHPEDHLILYGNALVCRSCEEEAAVAAPVVDTTGAFETADFQFAALSPVLTDAEAEEVETVASVVKSRVDKAHVEGRKEDALALSLALQTVRNLTGRIARTTPVQGIRPPLRLVA